MSEPDAPSGKTDNLQRNRHYGMRLMRLNQDRTKVEKAAEAAKKKATKKA